MADRYDVAIVGAGPAGAAAARQLAAHGASVLVLDRKRFPRDKVCGDVLTPRALRALARVGLAALPERHQRLDGIWFVKGNRRREWAFTNEPGPFTFGSVIPRRILDDHLRRAAEDAGAVLWQGAAASELLYDRHRSAAGVVVDRTDGRCEVRAPFVVVCDGATGLVGRQLRTGASRFEGTPGYALRQYVEHVRGLQSFAEFHLPLTWAGRRLSGYGWICPVSPTTANVGVGFLHEEPTDEASLVAVFDGFVRGLTDRDPRFAHARPVGGPEGGVVRASMRNPFTLPRGVLAAGDAAGLASPYLGEGIVYALESGELAARSILTMLERGASRRVHAQRLVRAFPRQWALRDAPRHHRWVGSGDVLYDEGQTSTGIVAALANFLLDRPLAPDAVTRALASAPEGARALRLGASMLGVLVSRLRSIDRVAAEILAVLPWTQSAALLPFLVAGRVPRAHLHAPAARDAVLAVAAFTIAQVIRDDAREGAAERTHATNSLAIVLGDCLLGEATTALARLPRASYAALTAAFRRATSARLAALPGSLTRDAAAERYARLGAPCTTLGRLLAGKRRATRARARGDEWVAATFLATLDLERDPEGDAAAFIQTQLGVAGAAERHGLEPWLTARARAALTGTARRRVVAEPS